MHGLCAAKSRRAGAATALFAFDQVSRRVFRQEYPALVFSEGSVTPSR